jgi:hypothetical protein
VVRPSTRREPDREAAAGAQAGVVLGPVGHPVVLLRDMMAASGIRFERQERCLCMVGGLPRPHPIRSHPGGRPMQQGVAERHSSSAAGRGYIFNWIFLPCSSRLMRHLTKESRRLAERPQQKARQGRLAIHHRRRTHQTETPLPDVMNDSGH